MEPYTRNMRQDATYWAPGTNDGFGNRTFAIAPVLIKCRWQDVAKLFRSATGEERTSVAIVYVDRVLEVGGYLVRGNMTQEADPTTVEGAHEVRQLGSSPNLRATQELLKVWL